MFEYTRGSTFSFSSVLTGSQACLAASRVLQRRARLEKGKWVDSKGMLFKYVVTQS